MKNIKSVLAVLMALCLMLCLAVPAFATETAVETEATVETTAAAAETEAAAEETIEETEAVAEDVSEEVVDEHEGHDHAEEELLTTGTTATETETNGAIKGIRLVVVILEVIASIALIVVIMMQNGKESGLGSIAGNSDSYMNKSNMGTLDAKLASWTKWFAIAWIVLTLILTLLPNA